MKPTRDRERLLAQFVERLKDDLVQWLAESNTKQGDLAAMLGVGPSAVSHILRPNRPVSEKMVRNISRAIPRFAGRYAEFYALKYNEDLPIEAQDAAEKQRLRAEIVAELSAARQEVLTALDDFTNAAIAAVKRI